MSPPDVATLRTAQRGIATLADRDLTRFWASLNIEQPEATRNALVAFLPALLDSYGSSAATVAADWYDEERSKAKVAGRFTATAAHPVKSDLAVAQVRFGAQHLFTSDPSQTLAFLSGAVSKYVLAPARQTVAQSAIRDPGSRGWARVTSGGCDFCLLLAGRGAVYSEASADFESHAHCNCAAVPAWD